jgi:hypothetical protein
MLICCTSIHHLAHWIEGSGYHADRYVNVYRVKETDSTCSSLIITALSRASQRTTFCFVYCSTVSTLTMPLMAFKQHLCIQHHVSLCDGYSSVIRFNRSLLEEVVDMKRQRQRLHLSTAAASKSETTARTPSRQRKFSIPIDRDRLR